MRLQIDIRPILTQMDQQLTSEDTPIDSRDKLSNTAIAIKENSLILKAAIVGMGYLKKILFDKKKYTV